MVIGESRWRPPPALWIPVTLCLGFVFIADVYQREFYTTTHNIFVPPMVSRDAQMSGFLVKTSGCRIPAMHPFDKSIIQYIRRLKHPVCNGGIPALVDANLTSIFIVNSSLVNYNVTSDNLRCCYRPFWRVEPKEDEHDKIVKYSDNCIAFNKSAKITEEYVKVECFSSDTLIYTDVFAFVPVLVDISKPTIPQPLNILILGLDAVSRLNLHRQLPLTVNYLRKLGMVELLGYNKVADNTFPNLIPILTGYTEEELKSICWPNTTAKFDQCPFIWKRYSEKSYKTVYAEDAAWMGVFNYMKRGFHKQPTDYYWSFFNRLAEELIGNEADGNVKRCVGARRVYATMLDYTIKFITTMANHNQPYFGFFWEVSLSHDFLNAPKIADKEYELFFRHLNETGLLNRTALFFLSDHGIRYGGIRTTFQGRMEERLPFLNILLPNWYKKKFHTAFINLQKNSRRLTTPFDLHETLVDLLDPYGLTTEKLARTNSSRGYSLFTKIPEGRTCEDAAISSHWCTCQQSTPIDKNDPVVIEVAEFTVNYINSLLEGYADCSNLTLNAVHNARVLSHNGTEVDQFREYEDYMITIETQPGGGVFEVTVRRRLNVENGVAFAITGTISRINLYGDQSKCVSDFHMKLYCYCKH